MKRYSDYLQRIRTVVWGQGLFTNVNCTNFERRCLLKYIVEPFMQHNPSASTHQNQWQVQQLAHIIGELGYDVDAMNYNDNKVKLHGTYDLVVDLHPVRNPVYKNHLTPSSIKVAYITGSNPSFANKAEEERIEYLYRRRGKKLKARRNQLPFEKDVFESYQAIFFIGNEYNWRTYEEYNVETVCFIRNNGYLELAQSDCSERSPRKFVYFGGTGSIHKGLDLLLDIFIERPELDLYVCSGFHNEKDFCRLYKQALFHTSNIHPMGFLDVFSTELATLFKQCAYIILPSCSEANAGSVLTGMSAGLIPLVSRESGFNDDEVYYFKENSLEAIGESIDHFSQMPIEWVCSESRRMISITQERYSPSHYIDSVREAFAVVLNNNHL